MWAARKREMTMFLQEFSSGNLIRIQNVEELIDPFAEHLIGCVQSGEEEQEPRDFSKTDLCFPSGEPLPDCWKNPEWKRQRGMAASKRR
jgi:hypothetical protein